MWIVPSRGRPDRVAKMFSVAAPSTIGMIAIDEDQTGLYSSVKLPPNWYFDSSPRSRYVEKHNYLFRKYPSEDWYGSLSDDMVPVTQSWDKLLIERAGRRGIAYADDLFTRRCGSFVIGGDLVRELGYVFCPRFIHFFGDKSLELMVEELGLAGLQRDIVIEHRHYSNRKSPGKYDSTSKERPRIADERVIYNDWLVRDWPKIKVRIQEAVNA